MVASASTSSPRIAQISYADRAKESKPSVPNALVAASTSSNHLPEFSGSSAGRNPQKFSITGRNADLGLSPTQVRGQPRSASSSPSNDPIPQGESSTKSRTVPASTPTVKESPANIWQIRKEQLPQTRSPLASILRTKASGSVSTALETRSSLNPLNGSANNSADHFVVRSHAPPPSVRNTEVWPEVGTSSRPTTTRTSKGHGNGSDITDHLSTKKEKLKWVPIPASELQAAADAVHGRSQTLPRNLPPYKHQQSNSAAGSPAGSGNPSMHSSRPSSTHPPSRVHSRTGSVHRSPKQFPGTNLPADQTAAESQWSGAVSNNSRDHRRADTRADHAPENPLFSGSSVPRYDACFNPQNLLRAHGAGFQPDELVDYDFGTEASSWTSGPSTNPTNQATSLHSESWNGQAVRIPPRTFIPRPPPPAQSKALDGYREVESVSSLTAGLSGETLVFGSDIEIYLPPSAVQNETYHFNETPRVPFAVGIALEEMPNARRWLPPKVSERGEGGSPDTRALKGHPDGFMSSRWVFGTTRHPDTWNSFSLPPAVANSSPPHSPSTLARSRSDRSDDWEVKDFGFGFGPMSGTGLRPTSVREEILARMGEKDLESQSERDLAQSPETPLEDEIKLETDGGGRFLRGRRGAFGGYRDRGGYRGRGVQGLRRGFGPRNSPHQGHTTIQPPFNAGPSNNYASLHPPDSTNANYYLPSPVYSPYGVGYDVSYAQYPPLPLVQPLAPAPGPISVLSFPLDYTRYYLLGQLEYYLSPQNMAQDFYLRQQMNPEGWISISLLASFNRVRQFTMDVEMVQEILTYSSVVEVSGDWVRMIGEQWRPFILPFNSSDSVVEATMAGDYEAANLPSQTEDDTLVDEDEDEEEVEFVMG